MATELCILLTVLSMPLSILNRLMLYAHNKQSLTLIKYDFSNQTLIYRLYEITLSVILLIGAIIGFPRIAESASATVDIEKILIESNAAHQGREHIQAVRERLEQGYSDLAKALGKIPEQQRQKEMQEAAQALNQQLELEKRAVNQVITRMMMEEIRSFRIANKIDMVVPKQVILDADAGLDITSQIIKEMNTKKPVFGQLPTIQIKKPAPPKTKAK